MIQLDDETKPPLTAANLQQSMHRPLHCGALSPDGRLAAIARNKDLKVFDLKAALGA